MEYHGVRAMVSQEVTSANMVSHVCLRTLLQTLRWRHNSRDSVSNHQPHDCLLNRLFRRRSKKTSKLRVTGLCAGNSPVTGEFPAQMASNAENASIWWRHHGYTAILQNLINKHHLAQYQLRAFSVIERCCIMSHLLPKITSFWLKLL